MFGLSQSPLASIGDFPSFPRSMDWYPAQLLTYQPYSWSLSRSRLIEGQNQCLIRTKPKTLRRYADMQKTESCSKQHGEICQLPNYSSGNKAGSGTRASTALHKATKSLILQGDGEKQFGPNWKENFQKVFFQEDQIGCFLQSSYL